MMLQAPPKAKPARPEPLDPSKLPVGVRYNKVTRRYVDNQPGSLITYDPRKRKTIVGNGKRAALVEALRAKLRD